MASAMPLYLRRMLCRHYSAAGCFRITATGLFFVKRIPTTVNRRQCCHASKKTSFSAHLVVRDGGRWLVSVGAALVNAPVVFANAALFASALAANAALSASAVKAESCWADELL